MAMSLCRASRVLFAALMMWCAAGVAAAQVSVGFYGHPGNRVRGGFLYFPHAYLRFTGTLEATGEPVDQAVGFTAASPGPQLLFVSGRGLLSEPDPVYLGEAIHYVTVQISDETYRAMQERLDFWREGEGSTYNLNRRNCITFVAEMARMAGLRTPRENTLSPNGFLGDMAAMNPAPPLLATAPATAPLGAPRP